MRFAARSGKFALLETEVGLRASSIIHPTGLSRSDEMFKQQNVKDAHDKVWINKSLSV